MNEITLRIPQEVILPDNKQWTNRFEIHSESSNRVYVIAQHIQGRYWGCSCPGWIRYKRCKHLDALGLPGGMRIMEVRLN